MPSEKFVKAVGLVGAAANWTIPIAVCHRFEEYTSAAAFADSRTHLVHSPTQLTKPYDNNWTIQAIASMKNDPANINPGMTGGRRIGQDFFFERIRPYPLKFWYMYPKLVSIITPHSSPSLFGAFHSMVNCHLAAQLRFVCLPHYELCGARSADGPLRKVCCTAPIFRAYELEEVSQGPCRDVRLCLRAQLHGHELSAPGPSIRSYRSSQKSSA
jgi:hypothetical protein